MNVTSLKNYIINISYFWGYYIPPCHPLSSSANPWGWSFWYLSPNARQIRLISTWLHYVLVNQRLMTSLPVVSTTEGTFVILGIWRDSADDVDSTDSTGGNRLYWRRLGMKSPCFRVCNDCKVLEGPRVLNDFQSWATVRHSDGSSYIQSSPKIPKKLIGRKVPKDPMTSLEVDVVIRSTDKEKWLTNTWYESLAPRQSTMSTL
jgi:hypothetical protein